MKLGSRAKTGGL